MLRVPSFWPFGKRVLYAGGLVNAKHKLNGIRVINSSGSSIAADKVVAVIGYDTTTQLPKIVLADADTATHTDVYVTATAIATGSKGYVFKGGLSSPNLNTNSASAAGDPVYLSAATAGAFAHTAPSGGDDKVIPVGWVTVKSATVGRIHWHIGEAEKYGEDVFQSGMVITSPTISGATLTTSTIAGPVLNEIVSATNVITAAESGTTFFLNSAAEFASTLPAPAAGLFYRFIVTAAPSSASYTVVTEGGCQVMAGHVLTGDLAGTDSGTDHEDTATGTTITFVDTISVVGDMAEVFSDGTSWFASCRCVHPSGITITG